MTPVQQTARWALVPLNPDFAAYRADQEGDLAVPEVSPDARLDVDAAALRGVTPPPPAQPPQVDGLCAFPSRYDLREQGRVTPARPITCGSCWTAATLGSLESFLAPVEMRDFSEGHLQLRYGGDDAECGLGGNVYLPAVQFAAWRGPVDEDDFDPASNLASRGVDTPFVQKHVQNILFLPPRQGPLDNCWIKLALTAFGGVYSSISRYGSQAWFTNHAYYYPKGPCIAHAVTIVGWDDDFDRHLFYCNDPSVPEDQRVPAGDGAFIVKDNQGPDWMENGYFYVSYYDGSIGLSTGVFTAEPLGALGRIYQYDPSGLLEDWVVALGQSTKDTWQANVFTARSEEYLAAVGFFEVLDENMDYQIQVHLDPTTGPVNPNGPVETVDTSLLTRGYFTVRLPQKVHLAKGQRFGIVLKGHSRSGGWSSGLHIERAGPGYSKVSAGPGQSFVSLDGSTWQDLTTVQAAQSGKVFTLSDANVRVKAFTTPVVTMSAELLPGDMAVAWEILNDSGEEAWVQPTAQQRLRVGDGYEDIGDPVLATSSVEGSRAAMPTPDGWVRVPPHGRVTAFSDPGSIDVADQVACALLYYDPETALTWIVGVIQYLNDLLSQPLQLVSTDPSNGAHVNYLGLSLITVTFDTAVKPGPGNVGVSVYSSSEVKSLYTTVSGNQLRIVTTSPLGSKDLGGPTWHVHLPADAALSQSLGNPLAQDHDWSFTVTGVN